MVSRLSTLIRLPRMPRLSRLSRILGLRTRTRSTSGASRLVRQNSFSPSPKPYISRVTRKQTHTTNSSPRKPSLHRSINANNQNAIRNMNLPHYNDEDVIKEINKINKELIKKGKYQIVVDYYDKLEGEIHHYYGDNSGFANERPLFICLFHNEKCVSSVFFEKVKKNGRETVEINVATDKEHERRGINSFLTSIAIRVIHLGFKYKEIYSSAISPISAWVIIKDYDVSTINVDTDRPELSEDDVKTIFPSFNSINEYYKKNTLKIKIPIKSNAKKAIEIEKRHFKF